MSHEYSGIVKDLMCSEHYCNNVAQITMEMEATESVVAQWTVWRYAEHQGHLTGCTNRSMLTAQGMSVSETSLNYRKQWDLDLLSFDGVQMGCHTSANGLITRNLVPSV
jgi:hypothetical protein